MVIQHVFHIFQHHISKPDDIDKIGLAIVNTILGGAMGGVSTLLIRRFIIGEGKNWSYLTALNGTLTGKSKTQNCLKNYSSINLSQFFILQEWFPWLLVVVCMSPGLPLSLDL